MVFQSHAEKNTEKKEGKKRVCRSKKHVWQKSQLLKGPGCKKTVVFLVVLLCIVLGFSSKDQ